MRRPFGLLIAVVLIGAAGAVLAVWDDRAPSPAIITTRVTTAPPTTTTLRVTATDGDSLRAGDENIRLLGIDAPELSQTCRDAHGDSWACGRAAKARLTALLARGAVHCTPHGRDRYGRTLGVCSAGDVADLGETLVREGLAVDYGGASGGYPAAEREARTARRGLWRGDFERPQDWRRRNLRTG